MHDIVVHDYGPGRVFVSLHAEVPADGNLREIHDVIDNAEKYLSEQFRCSATIHMDPIITDDPKTQALRNRISEYLAQIDHRLTMHDFHVVNGPTETNLLFDVVVPFDYAGSEAELLDGINQAVKAISPDFRAIVEIDRADG